ncbi:beta-N-acetylhexosaminidase [Rhizobium sp. TRM95111]|uniref:beta-N-acetylhexosaminidase n=1 Tax=Rhizobium alarense TaxID=2846851 RepID=UPI001F1FB1BC|nr:beta-N-acetylhexosaminidase [Rhizobium alarense]MCF3642132.1 beta-N-acetylhexosaminidase [Rhizobium alarense]
MSESKSFISGCKGLALTADEKAFFRDERPWGFILFGRNIADPSQVADLTAEMRETIGGGGDIPVLIDQEGGRVQRIKPPHVQQYPNAAALGAIYRQDEARGLRAAWLMSRLHAFDLARLGINVDCLPVLDVAVPGVHDVIGNRAYGREPEIVAAMGRAAADGLKAGGLLPVMKHMPGHGRTMVDSHHDLPVAHASRAELEAADFVPFMRMKDELMAMSAHIVFTDIDPANPATTSAKVVDEIIRGHIGFDGLLMSDDVSMNALKGDIAMRTRAIVAAGLDMVLHCHGIMEEMIAVAENVGPLSGEGRRRAEAARAGLPAADGADEAALREEFNAMIAVA